MSTEPSSESAALLLKACARCAVADVSLAAAVLEKDPLLVHSARGERGRSPLHLACAAGCREMVDLLLDNGTPWNVVDDDYISAGDLARENGHAELYAFLVERGVQTEMLLKVLEQMDVDEDEEEELEADGAEVEAEAAEDGTAVLPEGTEATKTDEFTLPNPTFVNGRLLQPRSKPGTGTDLDEYLAQDVKYEDDHGRLLDAQGNAIEMEWERIIMEKHAEVIAPEPGWVLSNIAVLSTLSDHPDGSPFTIKLQPLRDERRFRHGNGRFCPPIPPTAAPHHLRSAPDRSQADPEHRLGPKSRRQDRRPFRQMAGHVGGGPECRAF